MGTGSKAAGSGTGNDRTDGLHERAEERSLELHALVAAALLIDSTLLPRARRRVAAWLADGSVARPLAEAWQALLERPRGEIVAALSDTSQAARRLRQQSPFAGAVDPRTRWAVWRRTRRPDPAR